MKPAGLLIAALSLLAASVLGAPNPGVRLPFIGCVTGPHCDGCCEGPIEPASQE